MYKTLHKHWALYKYFLFSLYQQGFATLQRCQPIVLKLMRVSPETIWVFIMGNMKTLRLNDIVKHCQF